MLFYLQGNEISHFLNSFTITIQKIRKNLCFHYHTFLVYNARNGKKW